MWSFLSPKWIKSLNKTTRGQLWMSKAQKRSLLRRKKRQNLLWKPRTLSTCLLRRKQLGNNFLKGWLSKTTQGLQGQPAQRNLQLSHLSSWTKCNIFNNTATQGWILPTSRSSACSPWSTKICPSGRRFRGVCSHVNQNDHQSIFQNLATT